jgi:hypothetical protein
MKIVYVLICFAILGCKKSEKIGNENDIENILEKNKKYLNNLYYEYMIADNTHCQDVFKKFKSDKKEDNEFIANLIYRYNFDTISKLDDKGYKVYSLSNYYTSGIGNLPSIISWYNRRVLGINYMKKHLTPNELCLRYLFTNFRRDSISIKANFNKYKKILYKIIPKEEYKILKIGSIIDDLLDSYKYLNKHNQEYLKIQIDGYDILDYPYKKNERRENMEKNWYHSFWYRRYLENNVEITYKILKEIKLHYE